jgi:tRNA-binding EMAP/Myf-like protein
VSSDVGNAFRLFVGGVVNVEVRMVGRKPAFVAPGFLKEEGENSRISCSVLYGRDSCSMVLCTVE